MSYYKFPVITMIIIIPERMIHGETIIFKMQQMIQVINATLIEDVV